MSDEQEPLGGPVDAVAPWTIKAIASETRRFVTAAAREDNLTVGQWLERHFRAVAAGASPAGQAAAKPDFAAIRDMMQAAQAAAVASGVPLSKRTAQRFNRLVDDQVRGFAGLPPRKLRPAVTRIGGPTRADAPA